MLCVPPAQMAEAAAAEKYDEAAALRDRLREVEAAAAEAADAAAQYLCPGELLQRLPSWHGHSIVGAQLLWLRRSGVLEPGQDAAHLLELASSPAAQLLLCSWLPSTPAPEHHCLWPCCSGGASLLAGRDGAAQLQGLPRRDLWLGPGLLRVGGMASGRRRQVPRLHTHPPHIHTHPRCLPLMSLTASPQLLLAAALCARAQGRAVAIRQCRCRRSAWCISPNRCRVLRCHSHCHSHASCRWSCAPAPAVRWPRAPTRCSITCWWTPGTGRPAATTRPWHMWLRSCCALAPALTSPLRRRW